MHTLFSWEGNISNDGIAWSFSLSLYPRYDNLVINKLFIYLLCEVGPRGWLPLLEFVVMTDFTLFSILFAVWSKFWKRPPLQEKHKADKKLVLLWKSYSWCSAWFNFNICHGDISNIHFSYLSQVSGWFISGKLWFRYCYWIC
jgi:hypothetical protein